MGEHESFGEWLKQQRAHRKLTLRLFAQKAGIDPGNLSRYERGVLDPPQDEAVLKRIASALGVSQGSGEWKKMSDLAAIGGGRIPSDIAQDPTLVRALPVLFRVARSKRPTREMLLRLADRIRKA